MTRMWAVLDTKSASYVRVAGGIGLAPHDAAGGGVYGRLTMRYFEESLAVDVVVETERAKWVR